MDAIREEWFSQAQTPEELQGLLRTILASVGDFFKGIEMVSAAVKACETKMRGEIESLRNDVESREARRAKVIMEATEAVTKQLCSDLTEEKEMRGFALDILTKRIDHLGERIEVLTTAVDEATMPQPPPTQGSLSPEMAQEVTGVARDEISKALARLRTEFPADQRQDSANMQGMPPNGDGQKMSFDVSSMSTDVLTVSGSDHGAAKADIRSLLSDMDTVKTKLQCLEEGTARMQAETAQLQIESLTRAQKQEGDMEGVVTRAEMKAFEAEVVAMSRAEMKVLEKEVVTRREMQALEAQFLAATRTEMKTLETQASVATMTTADLAKRVKAIESSPRAEKLDGEMVQGVVGNSEMRSLEAQVTAACTEMKSFEAKVVTRSEMQALEAQVLAQVRAEMKALDAQASVASMSMADLAKRVQTIESVPQLVPRAENSEVEDGRAVDKKVTDLAKRVEAIESKPLAEHSDAAAGGAVTTLVANLAKRVEAIESKPLAEKSDAAAGGAVTQAEMKTLEAQVEKTTKHIDEVTKIMGPMQQKVNTSFEEVQRVSRETRKLSWQVDVTTMQIRHLEREHKPMFAGLQALRTEVVAVNGRIGDLRSQQRMASPAHSPSPQGKHSLHHLGATSMGSGTIQSSPGTSPAVSPASSPLNLQRPAVSPNPQRIDCRVGAPDAGLSRTTPTWASRSESTARSKSRPRSQSRAASPECASEMMDSMERLVGKIDRVLTAAGAGEAMTVSRHGLMRSQSPTGATPRAPRTTSNIRESSSPTTARTTASFREVLAARDEAIAAALNPKPKFNRAEPAPSAAAQDSCALDETTFMTKMMASAPTQGSRRATMPCGGGGGSQQMKVLKMPGGRAGP